MPARPFRQHHILEILNGYDQQHLPLDLFISNYYRANKACGPKDRAFITEMIYGMVRWQGLLDYLCEKPPTWEKRLDLYQRQEMVKYLNNEEIPLHVRLSFPKSSLT